MVVLDERELEAVLGWVEGNGLRPRRPVEAVDDFALNACKVNRIVERADDAVVPGEVSVPCVGHSVGGMLTPVASSI